MDANSQRPKMGEDGYTSEDGQKDTVALERAVMRGPEAVERFYARRGGAPFTAAALAIACRYMGLETVQVLLAHGASFLQNGQKTAYSIPRENYEVMVLADTPAVMRRTAKREISAEERLEIVRALLKAGAADLSEVLYQAMLHQDFQIARELIAAGKELPTRRVTLISGSAGFINPGAGVEESARMAFRRALRKADNSALMEMITLMRQCPGVDKVAVYELDVCFIDSYSTNGKSIKDRFQTTDMLLFMLENTTMRKVVTRRMLVELLVRNDDARGLQWLVDNGFLNRRTEISMLFEVLEEAPGTHAELHAIAVAHKAKHKPKEDALSIPTDPLAASILRRVWQYETADDGKTVRLLRYKGEENTVVIPPRIGRRTVTEIAPAAFTPPQPRTSSRRYYGYGVYTPYPTPSVPKRCFDSVSFPGTIREIPQCLGRGEGCATTSEIILQDGIERIDDYAFAWTDIKTVTLPDSVLTLGAAAFGGCEALTEAHLSGSLLAVPDELFLNCKNLQVVTGTSAVRSIGGRAFQTTAIQSIDVRGARQIGEAAFQSCTQLREVMLPESLTEIPAGLFCGCSALEEMPACPNLQRIQKRAFGASGLRHVHLDKRITALGKGVFAECTSLKSAVIDSPLQSLAGQMFSGCSALSSVSLAQGIAEIGAEAFSQCSQLEDILLPDSVVSIGANAFRDSGLKRARISAQLSIGKGAFADCAGLQHVEIEEGSLRLPGELFQGCGALAEVHLPDTLTEIGYRAFQKTSLQDVELPSSLTTIGTEAFAETQLKHVELPASVRTIGAAAFRGTAVETVRIPAQAKTGPRAFEQCEALREAYIDPEASPGEAPFDSCANLTKVVLGDGAREVPPGLCIRVPQLKDILLPGTITRIGDRAFQDCGLRTFVIPDTVTEIGAEAFAGSDLEEIVIPESVQSIGPDTFKKCVHLRKVVLPSHMKNIPAGMFSGCVSLGEVNLPETLESIGHSAFAGCPLKEVRVPQDVPAISDNAFSRCTHLRRVEFGPIREIGQLAFAGCSNLEQIELPDTLEEIGTGAFERTGLHRIDIPASVQLVGKDAFRQCKNLDEVIVRGTETHFQKRAFSRTPVSRRGAAPAATPNGKRKRKKKWR